MESTFKWVSSSPSPAMVANLETCFPEIVQVPLTAWEDEIGCWEKMAVLARTFYRWVPPDAIIRELRRAGVPSDIEAVSLAFRCHIFRFSDPNAKDMVLGKPWVVNGQSVATEGWRSEFIPAVDSVASALIWVRLPNLPMEYWTEDILRSILSPVGHYVFFDSSTMARNRGGFAQVRVHVALRRSFRPGVRVRGSRAPFWQMFIYEHLEEICSSCGSLHLVGPCSPSPQLDSESSSTGSCYGPWMAALCQRRSSQGPMPDAKRKP